MFIFPEGKKEYQFEESNEKVGAIFVRHPSWKTQTIKRDKLKELPMGYATEEEVTETEEGSEFYFSYLKWQETHHPIDVLEAFVNAFKAGIHPPVSVQEALVKGFQTFLESEGRKDLGLAFGFKNNKTSARRYFKKKEMEERNRTIIFFLSKLQFFFPQIPDEKIFAMVSEAIKDEIVNDKPEESTWGILGRYRQITKTPLSVERVKEIYYEFQKGEKNKKVFREQEEWGDQDIDLSEEAKRSILSRIPYREVPSDLKFLHADHKKPASGRNPRV